MRQQGSGLFQEAGGLGILGRAWLGHVPGVGWEDGLRADVRDWKSSLP